MKTAITVADYDFSGVKPEEMLNCAYYEYARESCVIRDEVENVRAQLLKSKDGQIKIPWLGGIAGQSLVMNLALIGGFPNTAWTELEEKDMGLWKKTLEALPNMFSYFSIFSNPPLTLKVNTPEGMTLDQWEKSVRDRSPAMPKTDKVKFGFFAINLNFDKMTLLQEFHKMLCSFEGKPVSETPPLETLIPKQKKPAGRKGMRDALIALGALRLRYYYGSFSGAQKYMRHGVVFYEHRESFNRACRSAEKTFKNLFLWIDRDSPFHSRAVEQK